MLLDKLDEALAALVTPAATGFGTSAGFGDSAGFAAGAGVSVDAVAAGSLGPPQPAITNAAKAGSRGLGRMV